MKIKHESSFNTDNKIVIRNGMHGRGTVCFLHEGDKPLKSMCHGCCDDFYNNHNDLGVKQCWSFKSAQVVDKIGHSTLHVEGGVDTKMVNTLNCWHGARK